ncbi:hypothetical protein G3A39_44775 [Paraburkholderia aspalathi]|nr:hypothetical protein [Paraburkholderia aspalathi]
MQAETSDDEPQQLLLASNSTTDTPAHLVERSRILETVIETAVEPCSTASTASTATLVVAEIPDTGSSPVSATTAEQRTAGYVRRSKRQKEQFPRGEKWKRRLPKCLHRK